MQEAKDKGVDDYDTNHQKEIQTRAQFRLMMWVFTLKVQRSRWRKLWNVWIRVRVHHLQLVSGKSGFSACQRCLSRRRDGRYSFGHRERRLFFPMRMVSTRWKMCCARSRVARAVRSCKVSYMNVTLLVGCFIPLSGPSGSLFPTFS